MSSDNDIAKALGRLIASYRQKNRVSREELAQKMDVSSKRIQQLESETQDGDFRFSLLVSFARAQGKTITQCVDELIHEAGLSIERKTLELDHFAQKNLTDPEVAALRSHIQKESRMFGNELAWALRMATELLSLSETDRLDMEMDIRRKSADRHRPEVIARIREIFSYTLSTDQ